MSLQASASTRAQTTRRPALRWLFAGQGAMGAAALEVLASRLPPVAVLTAEPPWGQWPVASTAKARGVECHHVDRIGAQPAQRWPTLFSHLDVAVCCCWGERLQPTALRAPTHGWLNLHPSALPAYRGADPVGWQLLMSPSQIPCSVHRITGRLDDGPVVADSYVSVGADDDRGTVLRRSGERLGRLTAKVLEDLARGESLEERARPPAEATQCPPGATVVLVDPRSMTAVEGARVARAFSPQPGIAIATMATQERFAVIELGRALRTGELPGAIARPDEDRAAAPAPGDTKAAIAFRDRWLRGTAWTLNPTPGSRAPSRTHFGDPDVAGVPDRHCDTC